MKYVIGVDLGTSAVKVLLLSNTGEVCREVSKAYPLIQEKAGYSEQDPEEWVEKTKEALKEILAGFKGSPADIEGLSFSGQMHGLVLLDKQGNVLRNAILWNDTRTTKQCEEIYSMVGKERLLEITKNPALEGFTLPKLLWVKEHERELFEKASTFLLPKDYLRYRLTGKIHMDYSDAAGTLLLDIRNKVWRKEICDLLQIDLSLCPPLIESHDFVGTILPDIAEQTGLPETVKVFAGGADNACAAIGSGVVKNGSTLCSIGTSGVVLSYEEDGSLDYQGKVHFFNHGKAGAFYTMGVTLAAGFSLSWFKDTFAKGEDFESFLEGVETVPPGAKGLLFTPYIVGERTPHADANIRGSFIGIDSSHERKDFIRAVLEGITFSLNETVELFRDQGKEVHSIISVGGGAKNDTWLQIQADIFNAPVHKLSSEQGPGIGAAMLAALGCGWYSSLEKCAEAFIKVEKTYQPNKKNVPIYRDIFQLYQAIYPNTKDINNQLFGYR
ncbi:xylulokinase [Neobacillus notoginsengisoli]|uniref:Xylulose kinase n=1 Tax=Neobacillus notoginsengisoli TaxID=1578198 RepID=A0A417YYD1_9BACI|nr:xylulokinase [Neobacillus notoginsengisoli]RHW42769.1 xylulokinase [Neobacillus notoginsengisoli]